MRDLTGEIASRTNGAHAYLIRHAGMKRTAAWIPARSDLEPSELIAHVCERALWVYDADYCGDETIDFVVIDESGTEHFVRIYHEWMINYEDDDDDGYFNDYIVNFFNVSKIDAVSFEYSKPHHDWLNV